jgi:Tol biopolymer transport system component
VLRSAAAVRRQLVWIDRRGMRLGTFGPPDNDAPVNPALSPDGQRVAIQRFADGGGSGVWTMDRARETPIRFDSGLNAMMPLWSPDGSRLWYAYVSSFLAERLTNRTAAERRLAGLPWQLTDWSADGRFVLANDFDEKAGFDVKSVHIENDNELRALPVVQGPFDQRNATFAPDSKWIVYDSNESGRFEVYAEPFPPTGGRWQISTGGGVTPRWSHSGREVFYVAPDRSMMSAPLGISSDGKAIEPGAATRLFTMAIVPAGGNRHQYVVAKDDQRFLVNLRVDETLSTPITIVQNWAAELGKK